MQVLYNRLEALALNSRLECLTQMLAEDSDVGILKHGFVVAANKDHLNAVHYLFPTQSFIGLGELWDIQGAEQPNFSWISGRRIVLYGGHAGPRIVENGVGQGKSKEPLQV
jgi:hypothetical protein